MYLFGLSVVLLFSLSSCDAFTRSTCSAGRKATATGVKIEGDTDDIFDRRSFLGFAAPALLGMASLSSSPLVANAKDDVFKPNPLTNPLLEQVCEG